MQIIEMRTGDLIPYENNPRKNDNAVEAVAASIREFGFKVPIIVDRENVIVAGHTRLKAAELLGLETVPVIRADDLTEEQVNAFRLADNKTGEIAQWDFARLEEELLLIGEIDMGEFWFDKDNSEYQTDREHDECVIKEGLYQLVVDCTDEDDMNSKYNIIKGAGLECRVLTL